MTPDTPALLRGLGRTVLEMLQTRIDLLGVEMAQERDRLAQLALFGAVAVMSLSLSFQAIAALAIAWSWDTPYRLPVAGAAAGVFIASCVCFAVMFMRNLRAKPGAFDSTLQALAADVKALT